jgi:starch phosphorylase
MKPIHSFVVTAKLPENLEKLKELAYNYWWCWNSDAKELFLRINRQLWNSLDHNPIQLINKLTQKQLIELSEQHDFTSFLDHIHKKYLKYLNSRSWFESNFEEHKGTIAYFSTEYGINESFPNYSGGLGVLSGDHLKSSSDLGLPLIGVGLLYQQGYFRQHLTQHGWQTETYKYNDFNTMPLILQRDQNGNPLTVEVDILGNRVFAYVWKLQIGRVPLYLLDSNIHLNIDNGYEDLTDQLYGGDRETRIQQEILLGIGGIRALKMMGIIPEVIHINEGHAAFALVERTKNFMESLHLDFRAAKQITKGTSIFTTHTPVPAGNEVFKLDRIREYFKNYIHSIGLTMEQFIEFGQMENYSPNEDFSMTVLGLKLTAYHNGVSKLHGLVARKMWQKVWRVFPEEEVPITAVTNGIHTMTWIARELADLFDVYLSPRWRTDTDNPEVWAKMDTVPNEELWREKQRRRTRLILFARDYLQSKQKGYLPAEQVSKINEYLDPDALTIGFARRFATYKRALLLFRDMDRLKRILQNPQRPAQIILGGKAHPHDTQGKEVIQSIIQRVRANGLEKNVVFLEDYDMVIARFMVKGCDIWLNTPIRPLEASGTSGMKAAINGTLNFSILDGWWDEAYNGNNGFPIGQGEENPNLDELEIIESGELYDMLEKTIIPTFYDRTASNKIPDRWVYMMKQSIKTIAPEFSTQRMIKDYTQKFYIKSLQQYKKLVSNNAENANELNKWKDKIRNHWNNLNIINSEVVDNGVPHVGKPIKVRTQINLGGLVPDDVIVQVYYGTLNHKDEIENPLTENLKFIRNENNVTVYEGEYICNDNGNQGFTIRILPCHELLVNPAELFLCKWAGQ